MNLRIKDKLAKNILAKYRDNNGSFEGLELTRPERALQRLVHERVERMLVEQKAKEVGNEETWEERINRIDNYKFANPTPIKVHKSPTVWDKIKDKFKEWLQ